MAGAGRATVQSGVAREPVLAGEDDKEPSGGVHEAGIQFLAGLASVSHVGAREFRVRPTAAVAAPGVGRAK
eukprot:7121517-Alexandrium_andersonii.AAC.1